jgi:hypothetical protein
VEFGEVLIHASVIALTCMLVPVATLATAVVYAVRPDERGLALMRPLSLASIFAAFCAFFSGAINILRGIGVSPALAPDGWRRVALGASESLVPLFVAFGCLTVAWLVVTVGMRRTSS